MTYNHIHRKHRSLIASALPAEPNHVTLDADGDAQLEVTQEFRA